jgi:hypothetical protein
MKRLILAVIFLILLVSLLFTGYTLSRRLLSLPFRPTNDELHKKESAFNLDFLIPAGTYLDEKITIGEVIKIRIENESPFYRKWLKAIFDLVPAKYLYLADLFLYFFWFFVSMSFFRVFTFMGYGRSLRLSLLFGGVIYYFMPDFSPGRWDDILLIGVPLLLISLRWYLLHRKKKAAATRS